jgi:hypothetical protein
LNRALLFQEKEAKNIVPLRGRPYSAQHSAKPTLEVWELAPRRLLVELSLLFQEKEAKSIVPLRGRPYSAQNSAKQTLGVWGLAPKKVIT